MLPYEALVARLGGSGRAVSAAGEELTVCAAVLARIIPAGSLEQVIFRVDTLHALEERGLGEFLGELSAELRAGTYRPRP